MIKDGTAFNAIGAFTKDELLDLLSEKFTCPRCGRPDLPLALLPAHDKSCAFECGNLIQTSGAIETVEEQAQKIQDLEDRIEELEMSCRDGLTTIQWFEGWLRKQYPEISYTYRDVARMKNSIARIIGPRALGRHLEDFSSLFPEESLPEFRCNTCNGLFDHIHRSKSDWRACKWCKGERT